ncbi:Protein SEMI-ROLLED LEAF 2 [Linum grandiflorum]
MGVMSRRILPACGNLCCLCPSLRASSRQPVKRYKKLLADIFPKKQEAEPNDRKIGKLCEYAAKNPLRIPKIAETLEQRFYKELRHEHFGSVKVVVCIYRKLLFSCKDQMPLFAGSLLEILQTLLEQTQRVDLQILACNSFGDFISSQIDGTHMFNLEGVIPKLCRLSQVEGDDENALCLRSAGLQALASMVSFMGEHSHISMDFDNIISVTLENYIDFEMNAENCEDRWTQEVRKSEDNGSSFPDISKKVPFSNLNTTPQPFPSGDTSKNPSYWSRACLCNMARLAKEASTVRRILEPLFHNFDVNNRWSLQSGVACSVLMHLQSLLEETGDNSHLLLSNLIKHLDHKNVAKQPLVQIDIVNIAETIGHNSKQQCTVTLVSAISELLKHLRKCLQISAGLSSQKDALDKSNLDLQSALEKCILQLSNKVGDVGPILDMMAGFLENVSNTAAVARTTISTILRTSHIIAAFPNISYNNKAFPDALFHQLLIAMAHSDCEVRVGAHSIFCIVLIPSLVSPLSDDKNASAAVSRSFGSSQRLKAESFSTRHNGNDKAAAANGKLLEGDIELVDVTEKATKTSNLLCHPKILKQSISDGKMVLTFFLVSLLLSSIWVQAINAENAPANFEAMANAYYIALVFSRSKAANHIALVRCFQLAFSLRSISLDKEAGLQPSRRRSLFTLSSCMLLFSAKAGDVQELIPFVQASLKAETVDPYLELVEEVKLLDVHVKSDVKKMVYGSEEDDAAALISLSSVEANDQLLKETVISHFSTKLSKLSEDEMVEIKQQLLLGFSPDDAYPLGGPLFMETPRPCSPLNQLDIHSLQEVILEAALTDDEVLTEANGSHSDRKTSLSANTADILSVHELLDSVSETARQVASSQVSYSTVPYDQMMTQCEALVSGKQQKMSMLHSFKHQHDTSRIFPSEDERKSNTEVDTILQSSQGSRESYSSEQSHGSNQLVVSSLGCGQNSFRLPPSSPYDKFLKAAGC